MQPISSGNIDSRHFIDRLENDIVQLAKTLAVENKLSIEEAKLMARNITQLKLNQILTDDEKKGIELLKAETFSAIRGQDIPDQKAYSKSVYELLKTMGLL